MTVKECYALMNADFNDVMSRLLTEARVSKFTIRFLDDPSLRQLLDSYANGDIEGAFRASHTLKGTAANMAFTGIFEKASAVCEDLRHGNPSADIGEMIKACEKEYNNVMAIISRYAAEKTD